MTTSSNSSAGGASDQGGERQLIQPQEWAVLNSGAKVFGSDGEQFGTVREVMEHMLQLKVPDGMLTEREVYLPREFVDRVEGDQIHLNRSAGELKDMQLDTPPGLK